MNIFQEGFFNARSSRLPWKIECDALNEGDWIWAAARVAENFSFCDVYGIPKGGVLFEKCLRHYIKSDGDYFLIVDDVLTTGDSMEAAKKHTRSRHPNLPRIGIVLFAREKPADWITAIWQLWPR